MPTTPTETAGNAQRRDGLRGIQPENSRTGRRRTEYAAGGGGVPAGTVVRRITAAGFEHPAADFVADHHGRDQLPAIHRFSRHRHRRHDRRQHHRAGMVTATGVVQFQGMGGDTIEHGGLSRASALIGAPDQRAPDFTVEHLTCLFRDIAASPGQGRAEGVEYVPLGLCHQCGRQVFESGVDAELRQSLHPLTHER